MPKEELLKPYLCHAKNEYHKATYSCPLFTLSKEAEKIRSVARVCADCCFGEYIGPKKPVWGGF